MTNNGYLTENNLVMLQYFWEEKRDIERYCDFEKIKPLLEKEKPEVLKAWNEYKMSIKTMDAIMKSL